MKISHAEQLSDDKPAWIYIRKGSISDPESFDKQRVQFREECEKQGYRILGETVAVGKGDVSISHGNNMRWSYTNAMKSGNFLGTVATYGYTLINRGTEIINEDEAKVVRLIKDLYLSGMGLQKIANHLNAHGIMRRSGKPWNAMAVKYVLTNERYVGDDLRDLADMLEDMETEMTDYDEDIVRAIIKNATVVSDTELRIHLHGGLTVTEYLPQYYSRRCKHQ